MANSVRRLDMPDMVHEEYTIPGLGSIVDIAIPKACNPSQRSARCNPMCRRLQPHVSEATTPLGAHAATACRAVPRLQPYVLQAKLVIEVDGPSHYTHHALSPKQGGPPVVVNGPTRMKVRMLLLTLTLIPTLTRTLALTLTTDPDPDPDH